MGSVGSGRECILNQLVFNYSFGRNNIDVCVHFSFFFKEFKIIIILV